LIAARLVRDAIQLCFLMERQYAPYAKWFGTAFRQLSCATAVMPILHGVQRAATWAGREVHLTGVYAHLADMHSALNITAAVQTRVTSFFTRPFKVLNTGALIEAIQEQIRDPIVMRIANTRLIGSIDQFSDSTDLREDVDRRQVLKRLYD
jgi:hypothetical protein